MIDKNDILQALKELYRRVGTQSGLAELAGITQSTINAYLNGKAKIENMPLGVFLKLFREMKIDFFGELPSRNITGSNVISNTGDINEPVNQVSGGVFGLKNFLGSKAGNKNESDAGTNMVPLRILERKIRKSNKFSPEERLKFLDFLDEEL